MAFVRATVALATIAGTITAPILLLALRSAADLAGFSLVSRFFALVWGLLFLRNFLFYSLATLMAGRALSSSSLPAGGEVGSF